MAAAIGLLGHSFGMVQDSLGGAIFAWVLIVVALFVALQAGIECGPEDFE
jgi:hypothetical protein